MLLWRILTRRPSHTPVQCRRCTRADIHHVVQSYNYHSLGLQMRTLSPPARFTHPGVRPCTHSSLLCQSPPGKSKCEGAGLHHQDAPQHPSEHPEKGTCGHSHRNDQDSQSQHLPHSVTWVPPGHSALAWGHEEALPLQKRRRWVQGLFTPP